MLDGVFLAEDGREAHDDGSEGRLDVLIGVVDQLLDARQTVVHDQTFPVGRVQRLAKLFHLGSGWKKTGLIKDMQQRRRRRRFRCRTV